MAYIQYIKVPFISALSIDDYVESLTLGIIPSGEYIEAGYAVDSFTGYFTGFNRFFSGSGYWLTSGSTLDTSFFLNDSFSGYGATTYRNSSLNGGFIYQQYVTNSGATTGNLYLIQNNVNDTFSNYVSGTYQNACLTGGSTQNAYSSITGTLTGAVYDYINNITGNAGGGTGVAGSGHYWRITTNTDVSSSFGYINNGYYVTTGNWADYLPYTNSSTGDPIGPFSFTDFTVEFWMKRNGWGPLGDMIAETNPNVGFSIQRYSNTDKLIVYANNSSMISSGTISDNSWTHVAFVRQGSGLLLYFSGILTANNPAAPNTGRLQSNYILSLGCLSSLAGGSYSLPYVGAIDEWRAWDYARSQTEIQNNMNAQIISAPGLVNYLTFDS